MQDKVAIVGKSLFFRLAGERYVDASRAEVLVMLQSRKGWGFRKAIAKEVRQKKVPRWWVLILPHRLLLAEDNSAKLAALRPRRITA